MRSRDRFSLGDDLGPVVLVVGDPGGVSGRVGCALHGPLRNLPRSDIDGERAKTDKNRGAKPGHNRYRPPLVVAEAANVKRRRAQKTTLLRAALSRCDHELDFILIVSNLVFNKPAPPSRFPLMSPYAPAPNEHSKSASPPA